MLSIWGWGEHGGGKSWCQGFSFGLTAVGPRVVSRPPALLCPSCALEEPAAGASGLPEPLGGLAVGRRLWPPCLVQAGRGASVSRPHLSSWQG